MIRPTRRRSRPAKPNALRARIVWRPADPLPARGAYPSVEALRESRRGARERAARAAAIDVLRRLRARGVRAGVFGSLATGRFRLHSDVDFIVLECPPALRYRIETDVEKRMRGIAFGVAYADEMREPWRSRALAALRDESGLR